MLYCFVQLQGSNEVGEMWNICLWGTGSICPSPAAALPPNIGGSCLVLPSGQPCVPIPPWGADMCERYVRSHNSPHPALASNRQEQPEGRLMQSSDYSISMIGRIWYTLYNCSEFQKEPSIRTSFRNPCHIVFSCSVKNSSDKLIFGKRWVKDKRQFFFSKNRGIRRVKGRAKLDRIAVSIFVDWFVSSKPNNNLMMRQTQEQSLYSRVGIVAQNPCSKLVPVVFVFLLVQHLTLIWPILSRFWVVSIIFSVSVRPALPDV